MIIITILWLATTLISVLSVNNITSTIPQTKNLTTTNTTQLKNETHIPERTYQQLKDKMPPYFPPNITHTENMLQQWDKTLKLNTFEQVLYNFPFLARNMRAPIMSELHSQKACYHREFKRPATEFAIIDNQAYLVSTEEESPGLGERLRLYMMYLKRVVKRMEIPDVYFVVVLEDAMRERKGFADKKWACYSMPLFIYNKNIESDYQANKFLIPDLYVTYEFDSQLAETRKISTLYNWTDKIPKLYFRGAATSTHFEDYPLRENISNYQLLKYYQRAGFAMLSLQFPELIDSKFTERNGLTGHLEKRLGKDKPLISKRANKKDHLQYKYLLSADGHATAWKRPIWIMQSNSILFKVFSKEVQYFYNLLVPGENFILVRDDLSDMFEQMDQLKRDQERALRIVRNANRLVEEHFSSKAIEEFGGSQLIKLANIQQLNLTLQQKQMFKNGTKLGEILRKKRQQQLIELDQQHLQNWKNALKSAQIEEIVKNFPSLESNINVKLLAQIVEQDKCGQKLIGFLISDNKVYLHSKSKSQSPLVRKFLQFFVRVADEYRFDDMYFVVSIGQKDRKIANVNQKSNCQSFPIFYSSKDINSSSERSRLLIPDPNLIDQKSNPNHFTIKTTQWQKKQGKAFWRGKPDIPLTVSKDNDIYSEYHEAGFVLVSNERPDLVDAKFTAAPGSNPLISQIKRRIWKGQITPNDPSQTNQKWHQYKYRLIPHNKNNDNTDDLLITLSSNSVVMMPPSTRIHWFSEKLVPGVHFIPIADDLTDLFTKIKEFNRDDTELKEVVRQANIAVKNIVDSQQIFHTTAKTLNKYSKIQNLTLTPSQKQFLLTNSNSNFNHKTYISQILTNQITSSTQNFVLLSFIVLIGSIISIFLFVKFRGKQKKDRNIPYNVGTEGQIQMESQISTKYKNVSSEQV